MVSSALTIISVILVLSFLLFLLALMRKKSNNPSNSGTQGEREVRVRLSELGNQDYHAFHDVYLRDKNGSITQVDHVVISKYGVFIIETKNYAGWIYGNDTDREWSQVFRNRENKFYSPVLQNFAHAHAVAYALRKWKTPLCSIVCFTSRSEIKSTFEKSHVTTSPELLTFIWSYKKERLSDSTVLEMVEDLKKHTIKNQWITRLLHRRQIKSRKTKANKVKSLGSCPQCGSELVLRKSKKGGDFAGCNHYPECTYTADIGFL